MFRRNDPDAADPRRRPVVAPPLTSRKGGYLRCPFEIRPRFTDVAVTVAATAEDGGEGWEGLAGFRDGRPWTRAGLGAAALTAREKRAQQAQSEKIYGPGLATADDAGDREALGKASLASPTATDGRGGGGVFAMDLREQQSLRKLVPRHLRIRRERGDATEPEAVESFSLGKLAGKEGRQRENGVRSENDSDADEAVLDKGRRTTPSSDPKHSAVMTTAGKAEGELSKGSKMDFKKRLAEHPDTNARSGVVLDSNTTTITTSANSVSRKKAKRMRMNEMRSHSDSSNADGSPAADGALQSALPQPPTDEIRPMNKMQKLDQMRMAALFGKKKKY